MEALAVVEVVVLVVVVAVVGMMVVLADVQRSLLISLAAEALILLVALSVRP